LKGLEVLAMPVYTYRCESCGVQFEKTQKFSDPQLTRCPECGKKELRKVYTPVGIVFKGSGFYATDNRSPSGQSSFKAAHDQEKSADNGAKDTSPVKESKATDSAPAAKPAEKSVTSTEK
jgi:putative FmdB family regulatory protein